MKENPLIPELICSDFEVSKKFYTELLGFKILYERPDEGFAMLGFEGAQLMIDLYRPENKRSWVTGKLEKPYGRGINFQIETCDVDGLYKKLCDLCVPRFLAIEEKWYRANDQELGNRQFLVQDPDGYLLRFFQDLGSRTV